MTFSKCYLLTLICLLPLTEAVAAEPAANEPLGAGYKAPLAVAASISRITFYRTAANFDSGVTRLLVNGAYHTSLQVGGFTELCMLAPARLQLSSRLVQTGEAAKNAGETSTFVNLKAGRDMYVRVAEVGNGRASFVVVDAAIAESELKQMHRQVHSVSRVQGAQTCPVEEDDVAISQMPNQQVETMTIGFDGLFVGTQTDVSGLSAEGRAELDKLISRLQKRYGNFKKSFIQITGYSDPLGTDAANMRISTMRAQAIKSYMVSAGIPSNRITSEGRGSVNPVVTRCPRDTTPASVACHKPNRRLIVGVFELKG